MSALTIGQLEGALRNVAQKRNNVYNNSFALSLRWDGDNTGAAIDVASFQGILATLNLERAEEIVLPVTGRLLAVMVYNKIRSAFEAAAESRGKSIMFIHYAGHGMIRRSDLFITEGDTGADLNLSTLINQTADTQWFSSNNADLVWILDCCYAHVTTREPNTRGRIVEVISATDDSQPLARLPPHNTLTRKLRAEIARRKRDGHQFIEIADVMQSVRADSEHVHPSHCVKLGVSSVCLPFTGARPINPRNIGPSLRAVIAVTTVETITQTQCEGLIAWIRGAPPGFDIRIESVFETNSTLLIFSGAWSVYSKLAGLPGIKLVGEVRSRNRLQLLGQQGQGRTLPLPASPMKENVPFPRSPKP